LGEPGLPKRSSYELPKIELVRASAHGGKAFVLDTEGHWYAIGDRALEPAAPFDPDPSEGKVATFGSTRFTIREEDPERSGAVLVDAVDAPPGRAAVIDPIYRPRIFKVSERQLAVAVSAEVYVFDVGPLPPRLTKVCGALETEERLLAPAQVKIGALQLSTDRKGRFEIWTAQWGFTDVEMGGDNVIHCGEEDHQEFSVDDRELPLFHQRSLRVRPNVYCAADGGC
jgi:hypothetical protein